MNNELHKRKVIKKSLILYLSESNKKKRRLKKLFQDNLNFFFARL